MTLVPPRAVVRRESGLYSYDRTVARQGLSPVAGCDEAGRGACAGPLVVAAVVLPLERRTVIADLADSKLLSPATREAVKAQVDQVALAVSVVVVPAAEVDRRGVHRANLEAMRRAVARLDVRPGYVLTDGFAVAGIGAPGLGVWKGDRVSANVAAASVVAKVTRDAIMVDLDERHPGYSFAVHKGYSTPEHQEALRRLGPCAQHRHSYATVARVLWEETG